MYDKWSRVSRERTMTVAWFQVWAKRCASLSSTMTMVERSSRSGIDIRNINQREVT